MGWVGYLPGAVLRAPDSANNLQIVTAGCVVTALFVVFNIFLFFKMFENVCPGDKAILKLLCRFSGDQRQIETRRKYIQP